MNTSTSHSIVLQFPKLNVSSIDKNGIKNLVSSEDFKVEYFGSQLDEGNDFMNDEMLQTFNNSTYLTFYFDKPSNELIDYNISNTEIIGILVLTLTVSEIREINSDGKDVDIYFN